MAARVKVTIDQKAINTYFQTDPIAQAALLGIAQGYQSMAEQASPTGTSAGKFVTLAGGRIIGPFGRPYRHGLFRKSFHIRRFRGGYRVYNNDAFAHIVEYGSARNPAYAPMRRALMAASGGRAVVNPSKSSGEHTIR
jgi:hypothetical protein